MSRVSGNLGMLGVNVEVLGVNKVATDLKKVEGSFKKATDSTKTATRATTKHGAASRKLSFVLLELSRGAEDFAIGFGINGMSGAIRGASNNMSQMGSIVSPLLGTIAGFASASLATIPILIGMANRAKEAAEGIDTLTEALQRRNKIIEQGLRLQFEIVDLVQGGNVEGAQQKLLDAQRKLIIEQRKLEGSAPKIGPGGLKRDRQALILEFAETIGDEDILFEIAKQRGVKISDFAAEGQVDVRAIRRHIANIALEDIRKNVVDPQEIETAISRVPQEKRIDFILFLKDVDEQINNSVRNIDILEQAVRKFSQAVKEAEKSPAAQKKRQEKQQKKAAKDAKDEEKRLTAKEVLRRELFKIVEPEQAAEEAIVNRRRERLDRLKKLIKDPRDQREFRKAIFQSEVIEEQKLADDRKKRVDKIQKDAKRAKERDELAVNRPLIAAAKAAVGFGESFLSPELRRRRRFEGVFSGLERTGIDPTRTARTSLVRLSRLQKAEDQLRAKPQLGFSGVTEFAKVIQKSISERVRKDKLEDINEKQLVELKKIERALKNTPGLTVKAGP